MFRNYLKMPSAASGKARALPPSTSSASLPASAVCLLIVLYVTDELSYDRYNVNADRIYRIDEDIYLNNTQYDAVTTSKFFGPTLVASYPKIRRWSGSATRATCW
jgi:hypothetical protein